MKRLCYIKKGVTNIDVVGKCVLGFKMRLKSTIWGTLDPSIRVSLSLLWNLPTTSIFAIPSLDCARAEPLACRRRSRARLRPGEARCFHKIALILVSKKIVEAAEAVKDVAQCWFSVKIYVLWSYTSTACVRPLALFTLSGHRSNLAHHQKGRPPRSCPFQKGGASGYYSTHQSVSR